MKVIADLGKLDSRRNVIVIQKADRLEYVIAEGYDPDAPEGSKWDRGTYLYSLEDLAKEILNYTADIKPERVIEIATMGLRKLFDDDKDESQHFFQDEMDITEDEALFFGVKRDRKAYNIEWDTDGEETDLPSEVDIPWNVFDDDIDDYLSDEYEFCVSGYEVEEED